ncbi:MAG: imidazole glycerol phosphate synthase subunit HisF [Bacteroidetes bacterium]|nr:imidazole glycerol phosphate synthase subunit HisF [Bacteroidota bacterium]
MALKRIIPCLDVRDGRTVKGVQFSGMRDAGDPVELATRYAREGADELVLLDISAGAENRVARCELVERVAAALDIPFTVGGGVRSLEDAVAVLESGADKVAVNSAALRDPSLLGRIAARYGQQCVVLAVDARVDQTGSRNVYAAGASTPTNWSLERWVMQAEQEGAGEILYTAIDRDGTRSGFDLEGLQAVRLATNLPVIASGGAGTLQHFADALSLGQADAVLAASLFHFAEVSIQELRQFLRNQNIRTR